MVKPVFNAFNNIETSQAAQHVLRAINYTLENQLPKTSEDASEFLANIMQAFQELGISARDQIEMLTHIQDKSAGTPLYDLSLDKASDLINATEGPSPLHSANFGGREPIVH